MPINKNEVTKELLAKAIQCKTSDELMALAKDAGFPMTKEEADAYMAELADLELDEATLQKIAGGVSWLRLDDNVGS